VTNQNRPRRTCDKTIVLLMVMLLVMGLITLFSATYYQRTASGDPLSAVKKQLFGVALGAGACGLYLSGAGPTVICVYFDDQVPGRIQKLLSGIRNDWIVMSLEVDEKGAFVEEV